MGRENSILWMECVFTRDGAGSMEYRIEKIDGVCCRMWIHGQGGPAIYWGTAYDGAECTEHVAGIMADKLGDQPWMLVAYEMKNWNQSYSPWALPSVMGTDEFTGGAKETLAWLTDICIPAIEENLRYRISSRMLGGIHSRVCSASLHFTRAACLMAWQAAADRYGIRDGRSIPRDKRLQREAAYI